MTSPGSDPQAHAQEAFPILAGPPYANHAAMSPWPRAAQVAVEAFARANAERGPADYRDWLKLEVGLRERLARMLNAAEAADISLVSNTSEGIALLAGGLKWRTGDNVVTPADEFLTNKLPWEALTAQGVELRRVDVRTAADAERALLDRMDARTRVLTVSAVQWNDGFRLDLARLGSACRASEALFFVDAIQQFGALPVDVQAADIDCLAAGSHKWQMGPEGMGVFYCREPLRGRLALQRHGWRMLDDPYRFGRGGRSPSRGGRRFEPGSPNTMGHVALDASLGVLEAHGQDQVAREVLENTRVLLQGLASMPDVRVVSRTEPERRSGIVSLKLPGERTVRAYRALSSAGVVCAFRDGAMRLSPHFYQHGAPVQTLLNLVEDAVASAR